MIDYDTLASELLDLAQQRRIILTKEESGFLNDVLYAEKTSLECMRIVELHETELKRVAANSRSVKVGR